MLKIGDVVKNKISGNYGVVDRVNLGPGLYDCVLIVFRLCSDGMCIPRKALEPAAAENAPKGLREQVLSIHGLKG